MRSVIAVLIFCGVFACVGFGVMAWGVRTLWRAEASLSWPVEKGVVTSSQLGRHSGSKGGTTYSADVAYEFHVGGQSYSGTRVRFGTWTGSADSAQQTLNKYPRGDLVWVHYDPDDPKESVLEPGVGFGVWGLVLFGAVFAAFGCGFAILFLLFGGKGRGAPTTPA